MSSKPIFYNWDDEGSPGRNLTGNNQNRLKQILKACLVDGYGDKPAAGWELVHEHANGFTLFNGSGYINFVSNLSGYHSDSIVIYLSESITDSSEAVIQGLNVCSGGYRDGSGNNYHTITAAVFNNSSYLNNSSWVVVANKESVNLSFVSISGTAIRMSPLFFGNIINFNDTSNKFVALGGRNVSLNSSPHYASLSHGFTSLRNQVNGLAEYTVIGAMPFIGNSFDLWKSGSISRPYPPTLNLGRILVRSDSSNYVGYIPGACLDPIMHAAHQQTTYSLLGIGAWGEREPVILDNFKYIPVNGGAGNYIITDDPRWW